MLFTVLHGLADVGPSVAGLGQGTMVKTKSKGLGHLLAPQKLLGHTFFVEPAPL